MGANGEEARIAYHVHGSREYVAAFTILAWLSPPCPCNQKEEEVGLESRSIPGVLSHNFYMRCGFLGIRWADHFVDFLSNALKGGEGGDNGEVASSYKMKGNKDSRYRLPISFQLEKDDSLLCFLVLSWCTWAAERKICSFLPDLIQKTTTDILFHAWKDRKFCPVSLCTIVSMCTFWQLQSPFDIVTLFAINFLCSRGFLTFGNKFWGIGREGICRTGRWERPSHSLSLSLQPLKEFSFLPLLTTYYYHIIALFLFIPLSKQAPTMCVVSLWYYISLY